MKTMRVLMVLAVVGSTTLLAGYCTSTGSYTCNEASDWLGEPEVECSNQPQHYFAYQATVYDCITGVSEGFERCDDGTAECSYQLIVVRGFPCQNITTTVSFTVPAKWAAGESCGPS
jgi:hypothetical protein